MKLIHAIVIVLRNAILGGNLISFKLLRHPSRMAIYITECLFLYRTITGKRGIPEKSVYEVLPTNNIEDIKLGNLSNGETWFGAISSHSIDIVNLCLICKINKPKIIFEVGTRKGFSAFHFALNTPQDSKVYTLDLPKKESIESALDTTLSDEMVKSAYLKTNTYYFENESVASKITCLFGDSALFDFSPYYDKVDFFFIDGAHSYEYVRSDTMNALKCCHKGSVIAWHDFGRMGVNGVTKLLMEMSKEKNHQIYAIPGGSLAFMVVQ